MPKPHNEDTNTWAVTLWRKISEFFERACWKLFALFYGALAVFFYIWVLRGDDFPWAVEVLKWAAPILLGFVLKVLIDTHQAFSDFIEPETLTSREVVHGVMKQLRRTARWKHTAKKPIAIDILGVALHNSHGWIENELQAFLSEYPSVNVELRLAFVDPETLADCEFDSAPTDWERKSKDRIRWVNNDLWAMVLRSNGRLRLHVRLIKNLPHWHGILIERRYLFMGRVSWIDGTERFHARPLKLTCADNGYRAFDSDDRKHGSERVSLFRKWMAHYLYGKHSGRDVVDNISSFYEERPMIAPRTQAEQGAAGQPATRSESK